jgi:hypothetical protein
LLQVDKEHLRKLLVHSIPRNCQPETIMALFTPDAETAAALTRGGSNQQSLGSSSSSKTAQSNGTAAKESGAKQGKKRAHDEDDSSSDEESSSSDESDSHKNESSRSTARAAPQQGARPLPLGFESGQGIESRRAVIVFQDPCVADTAFKLLPGTLSKDSNGRATKEVPLPREPGRTVKV